MTDISDLCAGYCLAEGRHDIQAMCVIPFVPECTVYTKVYFSYRPCHLHGSHDLTTFSHCVVSVWLSSMVHALSLSLFLRFCWLNKVKHVPKAPRPSRVLNPTPNTLVCQLLLTFQYLLFCSSSLFTPNLVHLAWSCCFIAIPSPSFFFLPIDSLLIQVLRLSRYKGHLLVPLTILSKLYISVRATAVWPFQSDWWREKKNHNAQGRFEVSHNLYISFSYHLHLNAGYRTSTPSPSKSLCFIKTWETIERGKKAPAVTL